MKFNDHSGLEGKHAFLSPSQYHWLRYSDEKLVDRYNNMTAQEWGTKQHEFAENSIRMGIKLQGRKTLALYTNDAIGYKMTPEQILYFSDFCYGTTDAISFRNGVLRIHDLKTGTTKASMEQLEIYAALFCLEYDIKPSEIEIELRIYQNNEVLVYNPTVADILPIIDQIIHANKLLQAVQEEQKGYLE